MSRTFEIVAFLAAILLAALAFHAWLAAHDEQQRLQATLDSQKQLLDAANARENDRNATLNAAIAQIAKNERATQTPAQILQQLPSYLPLPQPISSVPPQQGTLPSETSPPPAPQAQSTPSPSLPAAPAPQAPNLQLPAEDLKPLYDFAQDCHACQLKLAVANQNATDDAQKISALTRERDAAVTAAKGGSFFRRLRRNALWFAIGAGVGYAAARR